MILYFERVVFILASLQLDLNLRLPEPHAGQGESYNYLIWLNLLILLNAGCIDNRKKIGKKINFCHILSHLRLGLPLKCSIGKRERKAYLAILKSMDFSYYLVVVIE